jgi:hypothetical protein
MAAGSPRLAGEAAYLAGKGAKFAGKAGNKLSRALRKTKAAEKTNILYQMQQPKQ